MDASVTKTADGYEVTIAGKTISLPSGSKAGEKKNESATYGTAAKYIAVDVGSNAVRLVENGETVEDIVPDNDDTTDEDREDLAMKLSSAWAEAQSMGGRRRRSRLNRKTRRSKGNRRNPKHRKLRKLATRRR